MTACDAVVITNAIINTLKIKSLSIKKPVGIGTDNTSVMVGINNGVLQKLREYNSSLILLPCVCHSFQLVVSAAANVALPLAKAYRFSNQRNLQLVSIGSFNFKTK